MKKTLLAVALLIASTGVFAQVNSKLATATKDQQRKEVTVRQTAADLAKTQKKTAVKGTVEGAKILTDFSAQYPYTTGVDANHTGNGEYTKFLIKSDTNSVMSVYTPNPNPYIANYWGINQAGNWWLLNEYADFSAENGFAYIDWYRIAYEDKQANARFNAWIMPEKTIRTYGKRGIDIYISQFCVIFNFQQYFIDWCHDAEFAPGTYDSMEFNLRNIDADLQQGITKITLPTNTSNCPLISTDEDEETYIRVRAYCRPSSSAVFPQGYLFMVDDIAWDETPENRLEVLDCDFLGGYRYLPEIVTAEPFYASVRVNNSGANDLYDIKLQNKMVAATIIEGGSSDGSDSSYYDFSSSSVVINEGTQDTLLTAAYEVQTYDENNNPINVLRDYEYINAYSTPQYKDGTGWYGVYNELTYTQNEDGTMKEVTVPGHPQDYQYNYAVVGQREDGSYRWQRDVGATSVNYSFREGWTYDEASGQTYYGGGQVNVAGYRACLAFSGQEFDGNAYAWGVELIPAVDRTTTSEDDKNVREGAVIRTSLWMYNKEYGDDVNSAFTLVYEDGQAVQSEPYVIQPSDYNLVTNTNPTADLKSLYLPFTSTVELKPNEVYYACYEQVVDGQFSIAENYGYYANVFSPGYVHFIGTDENGEPEVESLNSLLIYSPGVSTSGQYQYAWGCLYSHENNPMIRLMISPSKDALKDAAESTSSFRMFPNPAKDNSVLDYTLATSGNVTIEVTDLMGRTLLSYNEGMRHAGIANKANIEANKLANGTYLCTVNVNGVKVSTSKMIVNR